MFAINVENSIYFFKKKDSLSIVSSKCGHKYEKMFEKEQSIELWKLLGLITNIEQHQNI